MTRLFAAFLISMLPLAAQTSSLQGLVVDGQSAAVPEAVVTATNIATSAARKTLTNATGAYSLLQMAARTVFLSGQVIGVCLVVLLARVGGSRSRRRTVNRPQRFLVGAQRDSAYGRIVFE